MGTQNWPMPPSSTSDVYSPAIGSTSLPCSRAAVTPARRRIGADLVLDELGLALLDHQHAPCGRGRSAISSGTSG
jgi:hypothetical protein